jgi:SAM-dependent methyltransferase
MNKDLRQKIQKKIPTLRMRSITRLTLDNTLKKSIPTFKINTVLDVGSKSSPYRNLITCEKYLRLDIDPKSKPDICCDLHKIELPDNSVDFVLATEVLEHLKNPIKAISEIYRVLRPEGHCLLSTRFIYPYHADPNDYYRYTKDSLGYLFSNFKRTKIIPHGNRIQAIWQLINFGYVQVILNIFNPVFLLFNYTSKKCPLGYVIIAKK